VIDRWLEEDDPIYAHPRDPYHRVDVRSSSRHVTMRHGRVIAESRRPKLLFETRNPIRYYLPFADVRIELLQLSDTVSECDVAWSLPHPLPEGIAAADHVCCYPGKVNIDVDGQPITEWPSGSRRPERSLSCPRLRQQCANRDFADKDTERVWRRERSRRLEPTTQRAALRKLLVLDAAEALDDARVPSRNRLEKLRGDRAGQYSIRVNQQWRICFRWTSAGPGDVEIIDYH